MDFTDLFILCGHVCNCKFMVAGSFGHRSLERKRTTKEDTDSINKIASLHPSLLQRMGSIFCVRLALPANYDKELLTSKLSQEKMLTKTDN